MVSPFLAPLESAAVAILPQTLVGTARRRKGLARLEAVWSSRSATVGPASTAAVGPARTAAVGAGAVAA